MQKNSVWVAMIQGARSENIIAILKEIPKAIKDSVEEVISRYGGIYE